MSMAFSRNVPPRILSSALAIFGALAAALFVQVLLATALGYYRSALNHSAWVADHVSIVMAIAYAIGFVVPGVAAGIALGRLLPGNPIAHVIAFGVTSPVLMYALTGPVALAIGWQVAGYSAKLCLIGMIAIRVHDRRQNGPSGVRGTV